MDKKEAIGLLKQYLMEIPELRRRPDDNQGYKLWVSKVADVIEAGLELKDLNTFTSASYESNIAPVIGLSDYGRPLPTYYQENITEKETALKSIIQKYEILGIEEEPRNIEFPKPGKRYQTREVEKEHNGLAEKPIQIFDKMQFHPKVVEASRALFKDGHYRDAIYRAFVGLNNLVKEKSGLKPKELRGKKESQIMAKVFDANNPIIKLNKLITDSDISEHEGFKFLFMGATIGIRNPKGHENIIQNDPYKTLEFLGFASLLMKTIGTGRQIPYK